MASRLAFVHVSDPDALARELATRGLTMRTPPENHDDGLRGCELSDADGYVLFIGCPV